MEITGFNIVDNFEEEDFIVFLNENLCKLLIFLVIINFFFIKILFLCKRKKKDEREREREGRKGREIEWCDVIIN